MKKSLLLIAIGVSLAGCASNSGTSSAMRGTTTGAGSSAMDYDSQFIQQSAQQAAYGIKLGQLILANAQTPSAMALGHRLVTDYTEAANELNQLASKKGITLPQEPDERQARQLADLGALQGDAFLTAVSRDASREEKKDIKNFEQAEKNIQDPDIAAFEQKYRPLLGYHVLLARDL